MVLMVGVDVHKDSHTAVVVDELGRRQATRTVAATDAQAGTITLTGTSQPTRGLIDGDDTSFTPGIDEHADALAGSVDSRGSVTGLIG